MSSFVLAIDQGTTSTRAIVFSSSAQAVGVAKQEFRQIYPHPGWIEHDPEDLWNTSIATANDAMAHANVRPDQISGLGITNQRETTVVWSRLTGKPVYNAIVWQDRRTADQCAVLAAQGCEQLVRERTGLVLDPYFSASKIAWILDHVTGARERAQQGELLFGTVDTYLLWRLTDGAVHASDVTNASRTALFNIHSACWDEELLRLFRIPSSMLPEVRDTAGDFGVTASRHLQAAIPVRAMAGDQQAALVGQACLEPGMVKATYGTGGFILLNTGPSPVVSTHRLLTSIAYQWRGVRHYALEGSIFAAGATIQWLRDGLGIIESSAQAGELAALADSEQGVYLVPAFAGLGAPHWNSAARGTITGLTRGASRNELARAALECIGYQTRDLLSAMDADRSSGNDHGSPHVIRVDGGMAASDWTMQFLADMLSAPIDRSHDQEATALGVARMAGWQAGIYDGPDSWSKDWNCETRFAPQMPAIERERRYAGWRNAIAQAVLG